MLVLTAGVRVPAEGINTGVLPIARGAEDADAMTVHVLDVGQGLSVLLESKGHFALYDGGPRSASSKVVAYLKKRGVTELDYCIASHYDEDHVSGVIGAVHAFEAGTVIAPDYVTDTGIYRSFMSALEEKGLSVTDPAVGEVYELGEASLTVLGPALLHPDRAGIVKAEFIKEENDQSVVVRCEAGGCSILLTGMRAEPVKRR